MGKKIKQFAARIALLVTKSFVYLWTSARENTPTELKRAIKSSARRVGRGVLFLLTPFYLIYRRVKRFGREFLDNPSPWLRPLSHRYTLHILILVIAGIALYANITPTEGAESFGQGRLILQLAQNNGANDVAGVSPSDTEVDTNATPTTPSTGDQPLLSDLGDSAFQPYLPTTSSSVAPRQRVEEYIVRPGDTLAGIAVRFHLQLSTILQTNNLTATSLLRVGQRLAILPTDGLLHVVRRGETVGSIAKRYQVSSDTILSYNRLPNERAVSVGESLIIPGGVAPATPTPTPRPTPTPAPTPEPPEIANTPVPNIPAQDLGTTLLWPTVSHRINQYFTYRHFGVDIHGVIGAPIYAAADGVVVESRWAGAYGNMTLIKHDNGLYTRYGHAIKNLTVPGQRVKRGDIIALLGSTGNSTGPHVHFEVLIGKTHVNPLAYTR